MAEIEASGRLPIVYLVLAGGLWLALTLFLLLIDSLKLHMPSLLAADAFWTYGRIHDAYASSLLYGFGLQWAMAGALWMLCHVGRARVVAPEIIAIGTFIWNFTVTIGVVAIFCGQSTGFEPIAMPGYLSGILFAAYLLIAIPAALTFHHRQQGLLYPSQWFAVGTLFWFPWIFSTASILLLLCPVRGALQDSISWWYGHNFNAVFLGFAGLGPIFYFIPKLSGRPLNSYYLASLAFWFIALFGSWGGIPAGAPLPSWIPSLGVVGTMASGVAVVAVARNFCLTVQGAPCAPCQNMTARFIFAGLGFWLLASAQEVIGALPSVSAVTDFTWFGEAQHELFYYGFFGMTLAGAAYHFVPRVLAWTPATTSKPGKGQRSSDETLEGWKPGLMRGHFWLTFLGVLICWLSLLIGGVWQGVLLQNAANTFDSTLRSTLPAIRGSTLGIVLLWIGAVVFLLNLALLASQFYFRARLNGDCLIFGGPGKERS